MSKHAGWQAPDIVAIEEMAQVAFRALPEVFRAKCGSLVIRVQDFAEESVLEEMQIKNPFELMGLYHGVALPGKSILDPAPGPDMVFLYRRPILDYWASHHEALGAVVAHVLIHEIGHHFGFSDEDMHNAEVVWES